MTRYYGIYLIPPPHVLHPIGVLHHLMTSEFNSRVASQFMVHCTLKGFTKLRDGASPADFTPALDALCAGSHSFTTQLNNVHTFGSLEKGASILLEMERTEAFVAFQAAIWAIIEPFIAPDCPFSSGDGTGQRFLPHISLTQYDTPADPGLAAQQLALCRHIFNTSLRGEFVAQDIQLIEFISDDWGGQWWQNFSFRQLKGWQLAHSNL